MSTERSMKDVTDGTGRQVLDDIFEESRMHRAELAQDVGPEALADMGIPSDPYVGYFRGTITVNGESVDPGETLVIASEGQSRRYLLKRWEGGRRFKVYQNTPVEDEKMRLLNVYRVMIGQAVADRA